MCWQRSLYLGVSALVFSSWRNRRLAAGQPGTQPVDRIPDSAGHRESDLSQRINVQGEDELGEIAATLNRMIERLEAAFSRQRQFTRMLSHELAHHWRNQAESTLALSKERTTRIPNHGTGLQESAFMSSIVGSSFSWPAAMRQRAFKPGEINLEELLSDLSADMAVLAREKGLQLKLGPLEDVIVKGDKVKLRQLFLNITGKRVRTHPSGGSVTANYTEEETAVVTISDTGIVFLPTPAAYFDSRVRPYRWTGSVPAASASAAGLAFSTTVISLSLASVNALGPARIADLVST